MTLRQTCHAFLSAAVLLTSTGAHAQSADFVRDLQSAYDSLLHRESQHWAFYSYSADSVGTPQIVAEEGGTVVSRAAYRYTNGDTDIVYTTVRNGAWTCLAYASESNACSLNGKVSTAKGSGVSVADVVIGGAIIYGVARALSSGSGSGRHCYSVPASEGNGNYAGRQYTRCD